MRILIKLSGESLGDVANKHSEEILKSISLQIKKLLDAGNQVSLVVGGGNLFRGHDLAGTLSINRPTADYIGMLATTQNALVLRDYFESQGIQTRVSSAITMPQICEPYIPQRAIRHLEKGRVVIFASGLGAPFFTTDTTAVHRALETGAELLVMAKNGVNGLYTADPKKDSSATLIKQTTCSDVIEKNLKVADQAAIVLARENKLNIKVVGTDSIGQCLQAEVGTIIDPI